MAEAYKIKLLQDLIDAISAFEGQDIPSGVGAQLTLIRAWALQEIEKYK